MNKETESIMRRQNILLLLSGGKTCHFKPDALKRTTGHLPIENHTL